MGAVVESSEGSGLHRGTNWWGAFVIGLAGPILVTSIDPPAVQALGAAAVPILALATAMGVLVCLFVAELAAMMPEKSGGLPSYAAETFKPVGLGVARHAGGVSAWSYWLGWFPVAPINMILAAAYISNLFSIPQGHSFLPFGTLGTPVSLAVVVISVIGILGMFVACYYGIRLGAGFATVLGIVSMVPLTVLVILPLAKPSSIHLHNLGGFHFAPGVHGSPHLILAWMFVMTWSVLAMEAAACYIGECRDPARDAKIAMTAEGIYGFFIFVFTGVALVAVLGVAKNADPLTIFTTFISTITGSSGSWVQWVIGIPLILALLLSILNAIMGCARSLYQTSQDGLLPRWFGHLNKHGAPDHAMEFNVVMSLIVLMFGSPLRIYIFSNMGYLVAIGLAFLGYFVHRHAQPGLARPYRLPQPMKWMALVLGIFVAILWGFGGWNSPAVVVGSKDQSLFFIGLAIIAAYLPLYFWRRWQDKRAGVAGALIDLTDLIGPAGSSLDPSLATLSPEEV
ncbi:MAG TPA: APC family permease [Acidimicrobiales bacterium]|jgi:amino acid transporter|nr:APC family permease [Acidimicrobiales bacterium]